MANSSQTKSLAFKNKLRVKLEEYGEVYANQDIIKYIYLLVITRKKGKDELLQDLEEFFEEQTEDFVSWVFTQKEEKNIRCRFFPHCTNPNCPFVHPTEKCAYFPNCKHGNKCLFLHENSEIYNKPCAFGDRCTKGSACLYQHTQKKQKLEDGFS
ncbi:hypothetical protein SteCoe_1758 [Stentor coeruleus]|uniref:C3H1-type domain-containing protein n=1 Tax=Stentor coeruleus TaxID=5963 RepID=A0A1R2BBT5_9CILI|nr:hypothetical protein SteCoe_26906 [Stentor coeruleus]OMJ94901.1 hypothetical protein SteCoe_1758 [Stentor coeruleus]